MKVPESPLMTAVQADGVLALFLQLQQQIDGAVVGVLAALGVLVGLQHVEVVQLVQAQDGESQRRLL
jgi:hypothetical protein